MKSHAVTLGWTSWLPSNWRLSSHHKRSVILKSPISSEALEDRSLLSAGSVLSRNIWNIQADVDPANPSETIVLEQVPGQADRLRVTINGQSFAEVMTSRVESIKLQAGSGDDSVTINLPAELNRILVAVNGGDGNDTLTAGKGVVNFRGGDGDDILMGSNGNDRLQGGDGNDVLIGGGGDDRLSGNRGDDTLRGGAGTDRQSGNRGNDWVYGTTRRDRIQLGATDRIESDEGGLQQFQSADDLKNWLIHSTIQNRMVGRGNIPQDVTFLPNGLRDPVETAGSGAVAMPGNDYSNTNAQVDGVDEQDIVETDGRYVYIIRGEDLIIVDAQDPATAQIVSRTDLGEVWGGEMYLDGDLLTVITSRSPVWLMDVEPTADVMPSGMRLPYGYGRPEARVATYDVTDRTAPRLIEETTVEGSVSTSRSIDGRIYLVVDNYLAWPGWGWPDYEIPLVAAVTSRTSQATAGLRTELQNLNLENLLPDYTTVSYDASGSPTTTHGLLLQGSDIWAPNDPDGGNWNLTSIVMINAHDSSPGVDSSTSVLGLNGTVYASATSLYFASQDWSEVRWNSGVDGGPQTDIYKFNLTVEGSEFAAQGRVDGTIVDEFSMDEWNGDFRIATTSSAWQPHQSSNVFVLRQDGSNLNQISSLTDLSPTERIYSARFLGDRLYMSTFLQIDPLLSIDLSDPLVPVVTGELEVPGFSSYLQAWGDEFLVGIGQDADPATGRTTGLQISLFDVSDDANPSLVGTYKIGVTAWDSYSQAQWDHHAFSLFDAQGVLAIPVSSWDAGFGYHSHLHVFQLDGLTGISQLGTVEHSSEVLRSLRITDMLFSLASDDLKITSILNPANLIGTVSLTQHNENATA